MSEKKIFADGFQVMFAKQEDFFDFLKGIGRNSSWNRKKSKDIRLVAIEEESSIAEELKSKLEGDMMEL